MRKLIFFLGPAGAGKTMLAKALASRRRVPFFDMDTLLRPAAEALMTLAGQDPTDRDSPFYKAHCRDLGYRITMDAVLENLELGLDAIVVGPFTRETDDPAWIEQELARISATLQDVEVKTVFVYLPDEQSYLERIRHRGSPLDAWKLENWEHFRHSLVRREIRWHLPAASMLYLCSEGPMSPARLAELERFAYGSGDEPC